MDYDSSVLPIELHRLCNLFILCIFNVYVMFLEHQHEEIERDRIRTYEETSSMDLQSIAITTLPLSPN